MRKFFLFLFVIAGGLAIAFALLRTPDTDFDTMRAKYGSPASRFLETEGGLRIHYRDEGCRTCPALVLLHGANSSLHNFEPTVERLGDRYRVITYDHPGHSLSSEHPRDDYSASGLFEALNAVAGAVGVETFILGGNSMGGWTAWRYTLANPERVNALILLNASGAPPPEGAPKAKIYLAARILKNPVGRQFARHFMPRAIVKKSAIQSVADPAFVTENMIDRYWELARLPGNRRAMTLRAGVNREPEYGERLGEITAPTLIIWGAHDAVTPTYLAESFDERIPDSRVVMIENAGHIPMEETPDQTAGAIEAFLIEQSIRGTPE